MGSVNEAIRGFVYPQRAPGSIFRGQRQTFVKRFGHEHIIGELMFELSRSIFKSVCISDACAGCLARRAEAILAVRRRC